MYQYFNFFDKVNNLKDLLEQDFYSWAGNSREITYPYSNFSEDKDNVKLDILLPGLKSEDINLTIKDKVIVIEGEKKNNLLDKDDFINIRRERAFGKFKKAITLPRSVEADKAKAVFKNGILSLTLNKKENEKPKKIEIQ